MVIKFNPQGRVVMTIGRRPEAVEDLGNMAGQGTYSGANKPYSFNRPTDIGWDANGNIFVSDGYTDSRVVKYDKNGRFIKSAGTRGNGPGQLNLPHTLQVDLQGNVYIGDRSNARVQVWDNDLNPKAIYDNVGNPWTLCISPGPHQYLFVSNSVPDNGDSRTAAVTGEIYKMELDGRILGKFGKGGKALKEFSTVHGIDCRNPNELYVSEITSWRAQKIILRPQATTSSGKEE
jgi:6-bladed beta-propeller